MNNAGSGGGERWSLSPSLPLPVSPKLKPQSTGRRKQQHVPMTKFFSHLQSLQRAHSHIREQIVLILQAKDMKVSLQTHLNILWHKTIPQLSLFPASLVLTPPQATMISSLLHGYCLTEVRPMVDGRGKWGVKPWESSLVTIRKSECKGAPRSRERGELKWCQWGQVA